MAPRVVVPGSRSGSQLPSALRGIARSAPITSRYCSSPRELVPIRALARCSRVTPVLPDGNRLQRRVSADRVELAEAAVGGRRTSGFRRAALDVGGNLEADVADRRPSGAQQVAALSAREDGQQRPHRRGLSGRPVCARSRSPCPPHAVQVTSRPVVSAQS
jgi:hypothetical protein